MQIGELFVALGLEVDDKKLGQFQNQIDKTKKSMTVFIATAAAVALGIERMANSTIQATVAMSNFNMQTGLSIQKLQAWQKAAQLSDITLSAEQVTQSISALQNQLTQIRLGGGNVAPFQLLGIDTFGKDAFQVLEDIRGSIQGIDAATATNLLQQIGLSPQFINVLRLTRDEFNAINKEFFLNRQQQASILKLGTTFTKLKIQIGLLRDNIVAKFAPTLDKLLSNISEWLSKNGDDVIRFTSELIKVFIRVGQVLSNASGIVFKLLDGFLQLKGIIPSLVVLAGILAAAFFPVQTAIAGLLLLLDDLAVFARGGDSLIGRGLEGLQDLGEQITEIQLPSLGQIGQNIAGATQNIVNNITVNSTAAANDLAREFQERFNDTNLQLNNGFVN